MYVIARNSTLRYRTVIEISARSPRELMFAMYFDGTYSGRQHACGSKHRVDRRVGQPPHLDPRIDGSTEDIFDFQDRIAANIMGSLEPRLRAAEVLRVRDRPTENLDAYHCVLKALSRLYLFTTESYRESRRAPRACHLARSRLCTGASLSGVVAQFPHWRSWSQNPDADRARRNHSVAHAMDSTGKMPSRSRSRSTYSFFVEKRPGEGFEMFDEALALNQNAAFTWALAP